MLVLVEGLITVAVLGYIQQVRPDLVLDSLPGKIRLSRKTVLVTLLVFAMIAAAGLSLLASKMPDGLEWSYRERPDQPDFKPVITNENTTINAVDQLQSKYTPMPDYTVRGASAETSKGMDKLRGCFGFTPDDAGGLGGYVADEKKRSKGDEWFVNAPRVHRQIRLSGFADTSP